MTCSWSATLRIACFVLHYGSELASGPPEQVLSDPRVIKAYIGARA